MRILVPSLSDHFYKVLIINDIDRQSNPFSLLYSFLKSPKTWKFLLRNRCRFSVIQFVGISFIHITSTIRLYYSLQSTAMHRSSAYRTTSSRLHVYRSTFPAYTVSHPLILFGWLRLRLLRVILNGRDCGEFSWIQFGWIILVNLVLAVKKWRTKPFLTSVTVTKIYVNSVLVENDSSPGL